MAEAPLVAGTGFVALDAIHVAGSAPRFQAGGSCGNVLASLAWLGWRALPAAPLGEDPGSRLVRVDFARFGVSLDLLALAPRGPAPVVVERLAAGRPSFSTRCPACGTPLPRYRPIDPDEVGRVVDLSGSPAVFYFDRASPASLALAGAFGEKGALVVFEPSGLRPPDLVREALSLAHVLKYSRERIAGFERLPPGSRGPLLEIQTLGAEGLRWRGGRDSPWEFARPLPVERVVDAVGCGDWCTAGILERVGRAGLEGFRASSTESLREALAHGQARAAWNAGFAGARGGMYAGRVEEAPPGAPLCPTCSWP